MADGGAIATSGLSMLTIAAKEFSVPVLAINGIYLLTPLYSHNQTSVLGQLLSPTSMISYHNKMYSNNIEYYIPQYDYISPELIDLYITNNGCHLPSYIYRLLPEYYHPLDTNL